MALLDFANRPHYVPAAFTATAERHVPDVIANLVAPPPARLLHQQAILDDALSWRTPAAPRVASLIEQMTAIGREARRHDQALEMPARLVVDPSSSEPASTALVRAALHEGHPLLAEGSVEALRTEVAHLRRALRLRPTQIAYRALSEIDRLLTRTRFG